MPGKGGLKAIEDAPGSYARMRGDGAKGAQSRLRRRGGAETVTSG